MDKIEKIIFIGLVIAGLLFTFLVPPFQKPDENRHYYQSEALSRGIFFCPKDEQGVYLPLEASVASFPQELQVNELAHHKDNKFDRRAFGRYPYTDQTVIKERNWCSYSSVGYLPGLPGILLGHLLNSRLAAVYLSRLFGLGFFFLCLYFALKRAGKIYRPWLYFYAALPMTLHQVSAISYDVLILSLIPMIYTFVVERKLEHSPYRHWLTLILLALVKIVYAPYLLLSFLLSRKYLLPSLGVILATSLYLVKFSPAPHFTEYPVSVDIPVQLSIILNDPFHFVRVVLNTFNLKFAEILTSLVGNFGWLDYQMHDFVYYLYFSIFIYLIFSTKSKLPGFTNVLLLISQVLVIGAVCASLYLYWTPPGKNEIYGIQGRYFLPLIPFIGILFSQLVTFIKARKSRLIIFLISLVTISSLLLARTIYLRYYDYSTYGVSDQELTQVDNRVGDHYLVSLPGSRGKLVGFYYASANIIPPTRYQVYDSSCQNLLQKGYLQNLRSDNGLYQERFSPVYVEREFCLKLTPLDQTASFPTNALSPLYLIPSLSQ